MDESRMTAVLLSDISAGQIAWSIGLGLLLLLATAAAAGSVLIFLPPTYFTRPRGKWSEQRSAMQWLWLVLKNLAGLVLIVAGVLMLVLPGQGILTIIIGLLLLSFPGKRKLVAELLRRTSSLGPINRWRSRFGKAELQLPAQR